MSAQRLSERLVAAGWRPGEVVEIQRLESEIDRLVTENERLLGIEERLQGIVRAQVHEINHLMDELEQLRGTRTP